MRNQKFILYLLCYCFTTTLYASPPSRIDFSSDDLVKIKDKALTDNKLYLAYFTESGNEACENMDNNIWTNKCIENIVTTHFYAAKIEKTSHFNYIHNVNIFPTIILFNPRFAKSFLIRIDSTNCKNAADLFDILDKITKEHSKIPANYNYILTNNHFKATAPSNVLYRSNIEEVPFEGYSIQVGNYNDYENVLREVTNLQLIFENADVLINVEYKQGNDKPNYQILVGKFPTRERAKKYKDKYTAFKKDAFIQDLARLKKQKPSA